MCPRHNLIYLFPLRWIKPRWCKSILNRLDMKLCVKMADEKYNTRVVQNYVDITQSVGSAHNNVFTKTLCQTLAQKWKPCVIIFFFFLEKEKSIRFARWCNMRRRKLPVFISLLKTSHRLRYFLRLIPEVIFNNFFLICITNAHLLPIYILHGKDLCEYKWSAIHMFLCVYLYF